MGNENTETQNNKVQLSLRMDPTIFGIVSNMAVAEDRSLANMVDRLLKQSPMVAEKLEAEPATAGAGGN